MVRRPGEDTQRLRDNILVTNDLSTLRMYRTYSGTWAEI
jgi:hypothetical protein